MSRWESRNLHYNMLVRGHSRREKPDDAHELCNQRAASKKTAEGHPHVQPSAIAFPWALQAKTHRPNLLGALRVAVFTTDRSYEQGVNYRYAELGQARTVSFWPTHT